MYYVPRGSLGVMIFPAYVQGGKPQFTSTEANNSVTRSYDIGKSYTPRFLPSGHFLLYNYDPD